MHYVISSFSIYSIVEDYYHDFIRKPIENGLKILQKANITGRADKINEKCRLFTKISLAMQSSIDIKRHKQELYNLIYKFLHLH